MFIRWQYISIDAKCPDSRFETDRQLSGALKAELKSPLLGMCPEILRVCKQIYDEALPFLYKNRTWAWGRRFPESPWRQRPADYPLYLAETLDPAKPRAIPATSTQYIRDLRLDTSYFGNGTWKPGSPYPYKMTVDVDKLPNLRYIDLVDYYWDSEDSSFQWKKYWSACTENNEYPRCHLSADMVLHTFLRYLKLFRYDVRVDIMPLFEKESIQTIKLTGVAMIWANSWNSTI